MATARDALTAAVATCVSTSDSYLPVWTNIARSVLLCTCASHKYVEPLPRRSKATLIDTEYPPPHTPYISRSAVITMDDERAKSLNCHCHLRPIGRDSNLLAKAYISQFTADSFQARCRGARIRQQSGPLIAVINDRLRNNVEFLDCCWTCPTWPLIL